MNENVPFHTLLLIVIKVVKSFTHSYKYSSKIAMYFLKVSHPKVFKNYNSIFIAFANILFAFKDK